MDGPHTYQEGPVGYTKGDGDETNKSHRGEEPGGHLDLRQESRVVEGDWSRKTVFDSSESGEVRPRCEENLRGVEANAWCRDSQPGGHMGELDESGDAVGDWRRQGDGDSVGYSGRRGWMDGAASGARHDSKRVETKTLI